MKTILCYGDSNTFGYMPAEDYRVGCETPLAGLRYNSNQRWTGVMDLELGEGFKVIEEGLCGRTTVFDDPVEGKHKNGMAYLLPCLESHAPLDGIILMLGTNDLKKRFSASALDIALGISALIDIVEGSRSGPEGGKPEVLLMCPPPVQGVSDLAFMFEGAEIKSKKLPVFYKKIAKAKKCYYLEVGKIIEASSTDGIHYNKESHIKLGKAVAEYIRGNMFK